MRSVIVLLAFVCLQAQAQDKIYYKKNKTDDWKVTEVTPTYIKGLDAKNSEITYSTTPANVMFIFNSSGNFLVIPKLYDKGKNGEEYVKNFLEDVQNEFDEYDKIITTDNNIIICKYESQVDKNIVYLVGGKQQKIAASDVAVIIFKNGEHKLFANAEKTFKVLNSVQDLYFKQAFAPAKPPVQEEVAASKPAEDHKDTVTTATMMEKAATAKTDSPLVKAGNNPGNTIEETPPPASGNVPGSSTAATAETELDSSSLLKLQTRALQNIKELGMYIQLICNKETDPDEVAKTIEQALALFVNEDATVEVSSLTRPEKERYKIKVYLNRMGLLKYDKVAIEWFNIQYTSKLRKGPDGFYYGVIEFEQKFTGISGDKAIYQDITRKTVEVILKTYEKKRGGEVTVGWEVFLGDIGITETKPA
jgi:hypothetical protein